MNSKTLKSIIIFVVSALCVCLLIVGVLWLLNQYDVVNVQPFLDYLYYQAAEVIAIVSGLGVVGVLSIVGNVLYSGYKIERRSQTLLNQKTQFVILKELKSVSSKLDSILAYDEIMANKNLSNAVIATKEDKLSLKTWLYDTKNKANELAATIQNIAENKITPEEIKETINKVVESVDANQDINNIVKGMM